MFGNIYLKTLHDLRGQVLAWALGLAALGAVNAWGFKSFQQMPDLISFLDSLPPAVKAMVGDVKALAMAEGFLRAKLFDPLPLLLAVFAVPVAAQSISGELEHKSLDLLMAQPIARWRVVIEKYLAVLTATIVLCATLVIGLIIGTLLMDIEIHRTHLIIATFIGLPLTWVFVGLAFLGSCLFSRARHASLLAGIVIVASYVFDLLRLTSSTASGWGAISLFAQHKAGYSLAGEISAGPILFLLGVAAALAIAALLVWERRNLSC